MNREELNEIIKKEFNALAGKKIKILSLVVKMGDSNIYQVIEKDSALVKVKIANTFFENNFENNFSIEKKEEEKTEVFKKNSVCLYWELIKKIKKTK